MSEVQQHIGRLKFYNSSREFGFIRMDDGREVFVHRSALSLSGLSGSSLPPGYPLRFEIITDRANRLRAVNVWPAKREDSAA
jgi:cold shock CspA family protein